MSVVELLREDDRFSAAAMPLDRLKGLLLLGAEVGDGKLEPSPEPLLSDAVDCVLPPIGTMRLSMFCVEAAGEVADIGRGISSSGGMASAAGKGRPRAAATIWYSVHVSEKSFRPLQNGANLRSICHCIMRQPLVQLLLSGPVLPERSKTA